MSSQESHCQASPNFKTVPDIVYDRTKPLPTITPLYHHKLINTPGYSHIALQVHSPPGGASPPHRHGGASVSALVIKGKGYNKMNDLPTQIVTEGDTWYEAPGCHHKYSANASDTEDFILVATFVVETKVIEEQGFRALVVVDEEYRDVELKPST